VLATRGHISLENSSGPRTLTENGPVVTLR
jgi:hypothetical protein